MRYLLIVAGLVLSLKGWAQDTELTTYLADHQVIIGTTDNKLQPCAAFSAFLDNKMKGKNLFVLAEGNEALGINRQMLGLLQRHFSSRNLRYCFVEDGRGSCLLGDDMKRIPDQDMKLVKQNPYMAEPTPMATLIDAGYYDRTARYEYVGIDFERPWTFYPAAALIINTLDNKKQEQLYRLVPQLKEKRTQESPMSFKKTYMAIQAAFVKNNEALKELLGEQYEDMEYLVSNANISLPGEQRDKYMADNVIGEIHPIEQDAYYLLKTSFTHASHSINGNLVTRLGYNRELQGKIMVMNVYCDSCAIAKQALSEYGYMAGETLDLFRNTAGADVVVFDLSELPAKYSSLKQHGDLLLYARNKD